MAGLYKSVFIPKGKIHDYVIKIRNGKPYLSSRPIFNKRNDSPVVLGNNRKFQFFAWLTAKMHRDFMLKSLWENSDIKGDSARNKIMRTNFQNIDETLDMRNLRLVPQEKLFKAQLLNASIEGQILSITFAPFDVPYKESVYPFISAHGVIRFYDPVNNDAQVDQKSLRENKMTAQYEIERAYSDKVPYRKDEQHVFNVSAELANVPLYNSKQICLTLILENKDGRPVHCSENVVIN